MSTVLLASAVPVKVGYILCCYQCLSCLYLNRYPDLALMEPPVLSYQQPAIQ